MGAIKQFDEKDYVCQNISRIRRWKDTNVVVLQWLGGWKKGGKKFHSHTSVNGPDGVALKDTKRKGK